MSVTGFQHGGQDSVHDTMNANSVWASEAAVAFIESKALANRLLLLKVERKCFGQDKAKGAATAENGFFKGGEVYGAARAVHGDSSCFVEMGA